MEEVQGVSNVLNYDNIAIVVLMVVALAEGSMIYYLLKNLFQTREVLGKLREAITILNERLHGVGQ
jgi:hypothetical protein